MVTARDVRDLAATLPRSYEAVVRDRLKLRVGRTVWAAFSPDELVAGLAFPREEREAAIATEPEKFLWPSESDLRYQWIHVVLARLDEDEMTELVLQAWGMCVPKGVREDTLRRFEVG